MKFSRSSRSRCRGSATILVLALLVILAALLAVNQRVLDSTQRELRLVEKQQLKKFTRPAAPARP